MYGMSVGAYNRYNWVKSVGGASWTDDKNIMEMRNRVH